jgi:hypothetical protein
MFCTNRGCGDENPRILYLGSEGTTMVCFMLLVLYPMEKSRPYLWSFVSFQSNSGYGGNEEKVVLAGDRFCTCSSGASLFTLLSKLLILIVSS